MQKTILWVGLLVAATLTPVQAAPLVTPRGNSYAFYNVDATWGWAFSTNRTLFADAIGYYDYVGYGLSETHQVGLWNASGTLLATAFIGSSNPLSNGYRYSTLASLLTLPPGTYTLAGFTSPGVDWVPISRLSLAPGVTYIGNRGVESSTFQRPTNPVPGSTNGFFSVNLNLAPELNAAGSGWTLALAGTLFALLSSRRRLAS